MVPKFTIKFPSKRTVPVFEPIEPELVVTPMKLRLALVDETVAPSIIVVELVERIPDDEVTLALVSARKVLVTLRAVSSSWSVPLTKALRR